MTLRIIVAGATGWTGSAVAKGVLDADDACPREAGERSPDPKRDGCPVADADHDTFEDALDKCPNEPETWNGRDDTDGCPDTGGRALVAFVEHEGAASLVLQRPINVVDERGKLALGEVRGLFTDFGSALD